MSFPWTVKRDGMRYVAYADTPQEAAEKHVRYYVPPADGEVDVQVLCGETWRAMRVSVRVRAEYGVTEVGT